MKPWNKRYLQNVVLRGYAPSRADRNYFRNVQSPIRLYNSPTLARKRFALLAASLLGRFVRRGGQE